MDMPITTKDQYTSLARTLGSRAKNETVVILALWLLSPQRLEGLPVQESIGDKSRWQMTEVRREELSLMAGEPRPTSVAAYKAVKLLIDPVIRDGSLSIRVTLRNTGNRSVQVIPLHPARYIPMFRDSKGREIFPYRAPPWDPVQLRASELTTLRPGKSVQRLFELGSFDRVSTEVTAYVECRLACREYYFLGKRGKSTLFSITSGWVRVH
jgi:hypothetical protein